MKRLQLVLVALASTALALAFPITQARAQWSTDASVNNPVCTAATRQQSTRVVSDGQGGAIVAWWDFDLTTGGYDIRAQRIGIDGTVRWPGGGVAICTNAAYQQNPEMAPD